METKNKEVTVTFINTSDIKNISIKGINIKRKYGKFQRKIVRFTAIDKTENNNL